MNDTPGVTLVSGCIENRAMIESTIIKPVTDYCTQDKLAYYPSSPRGAQLTGPKSDRTAFNTNQETSVLSLRALRLICRNRRGIHPVPNPSHNSPNNELSLQNPISSPPNNTRLISHIYQRLMSPISRNLNDNPSHHHRSTSHNRPSTSQLFPNT